MSGFRIIVGVLACMYSLNSWGDGRLLCLIQPERVAEVGSPVVGIVDSIRVDSGDRVKKGQVLAKLRSRVEAASLQVAKTRAQADADVRAARANYLYLKQQHTRSEELFEQKFISQAALDKSRAETKIAREKLTQAQKQLDIWKRQVDLAKAQLELRAIRAPFSGVIAERYVTIGERIEDRPMFRIALVDPLRVEVLVPAAMFGTVRNGMIASVLPGLPNADEVDAEVVFVDKFIDAASNTFRVRASLPNKNGEIPSGLRCTAQLFEAPAKGQQRNASAPLAKPPLVRKLHGDLRMDMELSMPKK